ncbi:transposase [Acinetobacter qingfengensis]|uniref:Transposase n=3 Tax=Acinetobacter qingfengensis TaxID=1262585 RepID=A0A1E7QZN3_9GAMM|nr:transposase [Acinetobacter qingfengensis]KAA8730826.1 transposase [Acinetobacter qingfengensis]OEY92532.1 transposase [Acinetobacter qingfengensis]
MKKMNEWLVAKATNGHEIIVKIIPLKRIQNFMEGRQEWVEVGQKIQLKCGQEIEMNLDCKSFYISANQLYKLP